MFRRRRRPAENLNPAPDENGSADLVADETGADELNVPQPDVPSPAPKTERPDGPWDVSELDEPRNDRIDLGALLLPAAPGAAVRVDVDKASGRVIAATIVAKDSALQLQAFAAPRSEGVWPEIRAEILAGITAQHGAGEEVDGPFGTEVRARVPVALPEGKAGFQPLRFLGVDGPRWFLRGVVSGRAALDPTVAGDLETLFRQVVVIRGSEARPPREPLNLTLPGGGGRGGAPPATADEEPDSSRLNPFARGPEITELR